MDRFEAEAVVIDLLQEEFEAWRRTLPPGAESVLN
jgi:hypothetical protein